MNRKKIARMIFSRILQLSLEKYLSYIGKVTKGVHHAVAAGKSTQTKLIYARVIRKGQELSFDIPDSRLANDFPTESVVEERTVIAYKWITTRNRFSIHILRSLLEYQRDFFFSSKESDLAPLTFKQFLSLYPHRHLDQSRLSRVVSNLFVEMPQQEVINLRHLFLSKKRWHSYHIREIINASDENLKDWDIQKLLARRGIYLSLRGICACRKLLSIPNYKERSYPYYYGKNMRFSDYLALSERRFSRIKAEPGIYEFSVPFKISYAKNRSNIVYIGSSGNLRKRIASYSSSNVKNSRLAELITNQEVFVRFCCDERPVELEKRLLNNFRTIYGELPKANILGADL
jgi:RNA polymerase sigma-54 factor